MALPRAVKVTLVRNVNLNVIVMTEVNVIKSLENAAIRCVPMDGVEATANKVCMLSTFAHSAKRSWESKLKVYNYQQFALNM